jgi:hypothetical protein
LEQQFWTRGHVKYNIYLIKQRTTVSKKFRGARRVTWRTVHTEDPQLQSVPYKTTQYCKPFILFLFFQRYWECLNLILFILCIVTIITHIHQKMHTIYIKSQIIYIHELSYMFQQYIAILSKSLMQMIIKLIHPIYIYSVKNK